MKNEIEIGREVVTLLDRVLVLSIDPDLVAVRIYGAANVKPDYAIGVTADRALRIGALFIRAAMRLDPRLTPENVAALATLKPVGAVGPLIGAEQPEKPPEQPCK